MSNVELDTTVTIDEDVDATVLEIFPDFAHWLDHPEIGPILREAAEFEWSDARLRSAISDTSFWRSTEATARTTDELQQTDPATYTALLKRKEIEIRNAAGESGLLLSPERLTSIAGNSIRFGWSNDQIKSAMVSGAEEGTSGIGTIDAVVGDIKGKAAAQHIPVTDEMYESWGKRIMEGTLTTEGVEAWINNQARSMFPHLSGQFDLGLTVEDHMAPMRTSVAQELDMNPNEILFTDPKWSALYGMSSMTDARMWARKQPEWRTTQGANDQAEAMVLSLAKTFGEIG